MSAVRRLGAINNHVPVSKILVEDSNLPLHSEHCLSKFWLVVFKNWCWAWFAPFFNICQKLPRDGVLQPRPFPLDMLSYKYMYMDQSVIKKVADPGPPLIVKDQTGWKKCFFETWFPLTSGLDVHLPPNPPPPTPTLQTTKLYFSSQVRKQFKLLTLSFKPLCCCLRSDKLVNCHVGKFCKDLFYKPSHDLIHSIKSYFLMISISSLILLRSLHVYILKQLFFSISVDSGFRNIYLDFKE